MTVTINGTTGIDKVAPGAVETADLPAGTVLQTVQGLTSTQVIVTTTNWTDTTLTASITPISSTSKILVIVAQAYDLNASYPYTLAGIRLLRDGSVIYNPSPEDTTGPYGLGTQRDSGSQARVIGTFSAVYLDNPGTTSAITFKTQARCYSTDGSNQIRLQISASTNAKSTITLMEIAA